MSAITAVRAEEILDSRKKPTLHVTVECGAASGTFGVPSGASTGSTEATELRDADGRVSQAVRNVEELIAPALMGHDATDQRAIDEAMLSLDGTEMKSKLGGNAMTGVSIAAAKAAAAAKGVETFEHLRSLAQITPSRPVPYLYMNYINGGKHASSPLAFQEHIIVPQADDVHESMAIAEAVDDALRMQLADAYGSDVVDTMGDEGGYVIPESRYDAPFVFLESAIRESGNEGRVRIATDIAASSFFADTLYHVDGLERTAAEMHLLYADLIARFAPLSIEDPFEESAVEDFVALQKAHAAARIVGDDLTTTNAARIAAAADAGAISAVIIKPNQVGTLSETLDAMKAARERGVDCIVSHRSGETMDAFIADLAFAFGAFGLKAGALRKPERRAKYERLASISHV
jgi:enolase